VTASEGTTRRDQFAARNCAHPGVIVVSLVEGRNQRPGVAQDHADAAPLASSRSG
jgi:hypothetical protein